VKVIFTPLCERHIDSLHEYIAMHASEERADGYVGRIVDFCNGRLAVHRQLWLSPTTAPLLLIPNASLVEALLSVPRDAVGMFAKARSKAR
jgi:hypothetical protein